MNTDLSARQPSSGLFHASPVNDLLYGQPDMQAFRALFFFVSFKRFTVQLRCLWEHCKRKLSSVHGRLPQASVRSRLQSPFVSQKCPKAFCETKGDICADDIDCMSSTCYNDSAVQAEDSGHDPPGTGMEKLNTGGSPSKANGKESR